MKESKSRSQVEVDDLAPGMGGGGNMTELQDRYQGQQGQHDSRGDEKQHRRV